MSLALVTRSAAVALVLSAVGLLVGGCAAVRPVTPPPPPPIVPAAFVTELPSTPQRSQGPAAPRATGPGDATSNGGAAAAPSESTASSPPGPLGAGWWTVFADPALDAAIDEALKNNDFLHDVRILITENELDPARPAGVLWPLRIGVPATMQHISAGFPAAGPGQTGYSLTYDEADVGVAASYEVDVWGKLDTRRRMFDDLVEQQRQNTEAAAQDLAQQITEAWFEILEQRALRALLDDQVSYSQDLLEVVKARFEQHLASRLVVLQQEQQLLATQAQVPLVTAQLGILTSRLAALLGRMPTPNAALVPDDRRLPDLPASPTLGAPAELLRGSPELRLAQARITETEHLRSENFASWLPTVEVFGNAGAQAFNFSDRFLTGAAGVRITWPIFDGEQRILRAKQLDLTLKRRSVQYELAFKSSIQRVQEAIVLERKQAEHVRGVRAQVELGRRVLAEARQLFEQGMSDYLPVLTALASLSNLERASIQAQRALLTDRIQLYRALGGAWSKVAASYAD